VPSGSSVLRLSHSRAFVEEDGPSPALDRYYKAAVVSGLRVQQTSFLHQILGCPARARHICDQVAQRGLDLKREIHRSLEKPAASTVATASNLCSASSSATRTAGSEHVSVRPIAGPRLADRMIWFCHLLNIVKTICLPEFPCPLSASSIVQGTMMTALPRVKFPRTRSHLARGSTCAATV